MREYVVEPDVVVPEGRELQGVLRDIQEGKTEDRKWLKWLWLIEDEDFEGLVVSKITPAVLRRRNAFGQLVQALYHDLHEGDRINLDDLIGARIIITLTRPDARGYQNIATMKPVE